MSEIKPGAQPHARSGTQIRVSLLLQLGEPHHARRGPA